MTKLDIKSCAINKNRLFLPFLLSVGIPRQVSPDWKRGRFYWTSGKYCNASISPAIMRMRWGKEERGLVDEASKRGGKQVRRETTTLLRLIRGRGRGASSSSGGKVRGEGKQQRVHNNHQRRSQ
jgi:hypothetical protein